MNQPSDDNKTRTMKVIIPSWANWIAMNEDGRWYVYERRPKLFVNYRSWSYTRYGNTRYAYLFCIDDTDDLDCFPHWQDSLQSVT